MAKMGRMRVSRRKYMMNPNHEIGSWLDILISCCCCCCRSCTRALGVGFSLENKLSALSYRDLSRQK